MTDKELSQGEIIVRQSIIKQKLKEQEKKKMAEEKATEEKKTTKGKKPQRRDSTYVVFCEEKGFLADGMAFTLKMDEAVTFDVRTKAESHINGLKKYFKNFNLVVLQNLVDKKK